MSSGTAYDVTSPEGMIVTNTDTAGAGHVGESDIISLLANRHITHIEPIPVDPAGRV